MGRPKTQALRVETTTGQTPKPWEKLESGGVFLSRPARRDDTSVGLKFGHGPDGGCDRSKTVPRKTLQRLED